MKRCGKRPSLFWMMPAALFVAAMLVPSVAFCVRAAWGDVPEWHLTEVSLDGMRAMWGDPLFRGALVYSLRVATASSAVALFFGIWICYLESEGENKVAVVARQMLIACPHLVMALLVTTLFSDSGTVIRLLAAVARRVGMRPLQSGILYRSDGIGVMLSFAWKQIPFLAYMGLSAMRAMPRERVQSARNLGASPWQAFWHVTLPSMRGALASATLICFAFNIGNYEVPKLLGAGEPSSLAAYAFRWYQSPVMEDRVRAMAANFTLLCIGAVVAAAYFLLMRRSRYA